MSYDERCETLGNVFLNDAGISNVKISQALAQRIQDTIEEFIEVEVPEMRQNGEDK